MKARKVKRTTSEQLLIAKIAGELKRASQHEVEVERKKHGRKAA